MSLAACSRASQMAQGVKNLPANAGDSETGFDPWVGKIPWSRKWQPTPVFMPRKFHGQRSLVGYNPWGRKASDANENTHNNPVYTQHQGVLRGRESHSELPQNHTQGQRPSGGRVAEKGMSTMSQRHFWALGAEGHTVQLTTSSVTWTSYSAGLSLCSLTCKMGK